MGPHLKPPKLVPTTVKVLAQRCAKIGLGAREIRPIKNEDKSFGRKAPF